MRIIKSYTQKGIQVSYFELEHKYLIKLEQGLVETTYKFRKGPGLESLAELDAFCKTQVLEPALPLLSQAMTLRSQWIEGHFSDRFDFEEII